jgi:hypothetical protein
VKEKSPSVIVEAAVGAVWLDASVLTTFTALTIPCAACGLPSLLAGMKQCPRLFAPSEDSDHEITTTTA